MPDLQQRLSDVLTGLEGHSGKPVEYKTAPSTAGGDHLDGAEGESSRPCLIAGNSRIFTSPIERKRGEGE